MQQATRLPELSLFDSAEQRKEKLAQYEGHLRKLLARIRRDAAITGKAGRKPESDTVELYQSFYVKGKPWGQCFDELWSKPGRKPPVPQARVSEETAKRAGAGVGARIAQDGYTNVLLAAPAAA